MPMQFPFVTDGRGCTASGADDDDDYVQGLIEQVLMTSPGERANRPDFGCGLLAMTFAPGGDALQAALQATVQSGLQRWLSDYIQVQDVVVEFVDAAVNVTVQYIVRRTQQQQIATFQSPTSGGAP